MRRRAYNLPQMTLEDRLPKNHQYEVYYGFFLTPDGTLAISADAIGDADGIGVWDVIDGQMGEYEDYGSGEATLGLTLTGITIKFGIKIDWDEIRDIPIFSLDHPSSITPKDLLVVEAYGPLDSWLEVKDLPKTESFISWLIRSKWGMDITRQLYEEGKFQPLFDEYGFFGFPDQW